MRLRNLLKAVHMVKRRIRAYTYTRLMTYKRCYYILYRVEKLND